jgi:hypothetical protein
VHANFAINFAKYPPPVTFVGELLGRTVQLNRFWVCSTYYAT